MWGDAMQVIEQWLPDADFITPDAQDVQGVLTTVPDTAGMSFEQAGQVLSDAGFTAVHGGSVDSSYSAGHRRLHLPGGGIHRPPAAPRSRSTAPTARRTCRPRPPRPAPAAVTTAAEAPAAAAAATAAAADGGGGKPGTGTGNGGGNGNGGGGGRRPARALSRRGR